MPPGAWMLLYASGAALLTWVIRAYALRRGLLDQPGERRSHQRPTPRGGGLAIAVMLLLAMARHAWVVPEQLGAMAAFGAGLVLVAGIGAWDDHRSLPALPRLLVHLVAATLLTYALALVGISGWRLPAAFALTVILINAWNFMDGIDGLATSQAMIAALGYGFVLWPAPSGWLALSLAAACAGFLPFNFPRARIFLGDAGSGSLGYALAWCAITTSTQSLEPVVALLPLGLFLVDASFTLIRRVLAGDRWWTPHVTHAYQILARRVGHAAVTGGCAILSGVATIVLCMAANSHGLAVLCSGVVFVMLSVIWFLIQRQGVQ